MAEKEDAIQYNADKRQLTCYGDWNLASLPNLQITLQQIAWPTTGKLTIDGQAITKMDSAGAWLLSTWQYTLEQKGLIVTLQAFSNEHQDLLKIVTAKRQDETAIPKIKPLTKLVIIGKYAVAQFQEMCKYLAFIGHLFLEAIRIACNPAHFRLASLVEVIYRNGFLALPIIALLSFLIGVVLTFQMGLQLRNYGANIFIVDLLGLSILREFGPLITAIMVAGRTGSAFTAQLGMMKLNQEIDALDTMGVTPAELLLLPRILGMIIALPLLTMWADMFGVFGGMVMSNSMLGISWYDFLERFPTVIPLKTLIMGLGKAPVFAMLIASIGCYQGMQVEGGADSVGSNTTRSVVLAIFFIIVADAAFSIIFSQLKL